MASNQQSPPLGKNADNEAQPSDFPECAFGFCALNQILLFLGLRKSRFYVLMAEGKMPRPVSTNGRFRAWRVGAIRAAKAKLGRDGGSNKTVDGGGNVES
jgi:predicted DNA-binding transcriptional regulator AlpA